jgi:nucleotide-binding universal stress UspA family protein
VSGVDLCHAEARIAEPTCCETIVCAIDTSDDSVATTKAAASLALRFTAKLILVHAVAFGSAQLDSGPGDKSPESEEHEIRARLDSLQRLAGVKVPICIGRGHTEEVVCDAVQRQRANLVIIGRGHHREEKNLFRSRVYWIVRESPCPVLSI